MVASALRTSRSALDPHWSRQLRDELGWLGQALGAARDADVLLARLAARAQALPADRAEGVREVIAGLEEERAQAHTQLLEQLRRDRYLRLLDRLIRAARAPAMREGKADLPARKALKPLVRTWRALETKVSSLGDPPADEELHLVRILAKRAGMPPSWLLRSSVGELGSSLAPPEVSRTRWASCTTPWSPRAGCATGQDTGRRPPVRSPPAS
jgi:CHAD domain-containing protein